MKKPRVYSKFTVGIKNVPARQIGILSESFTMGVEREQTLSDMIYGFSTALIEAYCRIQGPTPEEINNEIKRASEIVGTIRVEGGAP